LRSASGAFCRFLGSEVQHLVEVLGGENLLVGAVVAAHSAVFVQDEEEATGIACALCVLVG
jgi:CBS-domain-containing membrane protein